MFSFNFYFDNAFSIGSLADWVMVLVAIVSAVFLWHTLQSQRIVQRDQQAITKIEQERFRNEIMPIFTLEPYGDPDFTIGDEIKIHLFLQFRILKHHARNVSFSVMPQMHTCILNGIMPGDVSLIDENYSELADLYISVGELFYNRLYWAVSFRVDYQDLSGNKYFQTFSLTAKSEKIYIKALSPILK
jgi:hypothetical protein